MARGGTRTFYLRQVAQVKYLAQLAFNEAKQPPRFQKKRFTIRCVCHFCDTEEIVKGAVLAIEWICRHNKHSTYVKAWTLNGESLPQ